MQRENEKSAVPVQQHQANTSAALKPPSILQYYLVICAFWFYFLQFAVCNSMASNKTTHRFKFDLNKLDKTGVLI